MAIKHWAAGVAVAAFAAVGAYVYLDTGRSAAPESTFVLLNGTSQSTADLRGKVTLVNFWATTCVSCVKEMPSLVATYNKYRNQGFETVAVASREEILDKIGRSPDYASAYCLALMDTPKRSIMQELGAYKRSKEHDPYAHL